MRPREEVLFAAIKDAEARVRFLEKILDKNYDLYKLVGIAVDEIERTTREDTGYADREEIAAALWRALLHY